MPSAYECWLFDLDGTLVDVESSYAREVVEAVGERIDHSFSRTQADTLWHATDRPPEAYLREWGVDPSRFWTAFHEVEEPESRVDATYLYPDAEPIGSLPSPVGLVTHCQSYLTIPVLEALDIADWFDTVVCCGDDIGWKPDPRPVRRAIRALGGVPGTCRGVLVGDTATDVRAAWNAGIDGIHVERGDPATRGRCIRADARIRGCDELLPA